MSELSEILSELEDDSPSGMDRLLPLVYSELRQLAAAKLTHENAGQTLQATALVHEAYLRLSGQPISNAWNGRGHFFAAAAEAMRRILIEQARKKNRVKRGGSLRRQDMDADRIAADSRAKTEDLLSIHEALDDLQTHSERKAQLVKLRYFLGCTVEESAQILNVSPATAQDDWRYAKAWLRRRIGDH